jgi:hypothetical protein
VAQNADVQIDVTASQNDTSQTINPVVNPPPAYRITKSNFKVQLPSGNYFLVLLQAPYGYDSNPTLASSGIRESSRFDPSAKLALKQDFGLVTLTASSSFDIDQYADNSAANAQTWLSSIKLGLSTPVGGWTPYVQYQPALKYNSDYSVLKSETNDVGGGIDFKPSVTWFANVDIDFNAVRRYSLSGNSDAFTVKPTISGVSGDKLWRFLVQPNFRVRWYDEAAGISRTDETIIVPAIVEYDPTWLKSKDGDVQGDIEFTVTYTQNFSNIAKNRASQWIIGPVLELGLSKSWSDNPLTRD